MKKRNPKRRLSEFARCYGSRERVAFVKGLPCVVGTQGLCGIWHRENAHIESDGMGRKAGFDKVVPLCFGHHLEAHQLGRESFEAKYGINLAACAEDCERRFQSHREGNAV